MPKWIGLNLQSFILRDAIDDNKLVMTIKKDATFYDGEIVRGSLYVQKSLEKTCQSDYFSDLIQKRLPVIRTQVSTMVMNVGAVKEVVKTPISMDRNQLTFRSPTAGVIVPIIKSDLYSI